MKTLFTIATLIFITLQSCSSKPTTEDLKSKYFTSAQKYFEAKIDEDIANDKFEVESVIISKVDSIVPFSSYDKEAIRLGKLELERDLAEAEGNEINDMNSEKLAIIDDVIKKTKNQMSTLSKSDTIAFKVIFSAIITKFDGSKMKDVHPLLYFDQQGDIDGSILAYLEM